MLFLPALLVMLCACQSPEVVRDHSIHACFKNDTGRPILLWFWTGSGGFEERWFDLTPGEAVSVTIIGPINVVTATNKSAKISLKRSLPLPGTGRFYDPQEKCYYYRVLRDQIEPVLSNEAKKWHVPVTDERLL
jgi:hypothetical protein